MTPTLFFMVSIIETTVFEGNGLKRETTENSNVWYNITHLGTTAWWKHQQYTLLADQWEKQTFTFSHFQQSHFSDTIDLLTPRSIYILLESSLGRRAKTAKLSLLQQTAVKSINRLLWSNEIKLQPALGWFTVSQFCLSWVSCTSSEQ